MLEILAITGPIFLLIGTGFAAVRSGLLERAGIRPLGTFVVNFALPAMLFKTMAERRLDEALHWDMVIAYGLGSLLMVALTLAFTRFVQRRDLLTGAVFSMGTAMANSSLRRFSACSVFLETRSSLRSLVRPSTSAPISEPNN